MNEWMYESYRLLLFDFLFIYFLLILNGLKRTTQTTQTHLMWQMSGQYDAESY